MVGKGNDLVGAAAEAAQGAQINVCSRMRPVAVLFDCIVIGGGGAGHVSAATEGQRGRWVRVLEHSNKVGKRILMSGGGRCNFTNYEVEPRHYRSEFSHFCISALRRYPPERFLQLVHKHQVPYHEKPLGQLFCDRKSKNILDLLLAECEQGQVQIRTSSPVRRVTRWPGFDT